MSNATTGDELSQEGEIGEKVARGRGGCGSSKGR